MYSGRSTRALPRVGFPIRKSSDQRMVSSFPRLIAAAHVLLRLLAPRHPPCALRLLTRKNTFYCRYGVFKVRVSRSLTRRTVTRRHGLSKLNSVRRAIADKRLLARDIAYVEVDVISRRTEASDGDLERSTSTSSAPAGVNRSCIPRKEVIQPHLPVRLPCYDFTPIINPTFDGCLLRRG